MTIGPNPPNSETQDMVPILWVLAEESGDTERDQICSSEDWTLNQYLQTLGPKTGMAAFFLLLNGVALSTLSKTSQLRKNCIAVQFLNILTVRVWRGFFQI